jgi:hypothetical protein
MMMTTRRDLLKALLGAGALAGLGRRIAWGSGRVKIGIDLPPGAAARGATLAAEEARRTAGLLGADVEIGPAGPADFIRVVEAAPAEDLPLLVLTVAAAGAAEGRIEPIRRRVFHVASRAGGPGRADWLPDLERFGAEQLNQRFRRRFGVPMDERAWRGWMAVKIAAEVALRPGQRIDAMTFDGHKGEPLAFDPRDHHLAQPTYPRKPGR